MEKLENQIVQLLLQSKSIKLNTAKPYTWASGWKSPIYCDNRRTLSYPGIRKAICNAFVDKIFEKYPETEVIAGVATGAIAHGVLVAEVMKLPFAYVRSSAKEHGLKNLVEGVVEKGQKVVVIEDLVSTGGSSLKAVQALQEIGAEVLGMLAIFTYGFPQAIENFKNANVKLNTLTNYQALIKQAALNGEISENETETLTSWRENPSAWQG